MNNKKIIFIASTLSVFGLLFNFQPSIANAMTVEKIQAQISALKAQIAQFQIQPIQIQIPKSDWCYTFNVNLKYGDSGSEVEALHIALGKEGFPVRDIEENGQGNHFFGEITASMVSGFQQKYAEEILKPLGLQYGTGFVGKATRAKLNQLFGCGVLPPPPPKPISSITVLSPNGGESWVVGEKQNILWINKESAEKKLRSVNIYLDSWTPLCPKKESCPLMFMPIRSYLLAENTGNDGSFVWIVGRDISGNSIPEGNYQVRIADVFTGANDVSDSYFKIVSSEIKNKPPVIFGVGGPTSLKVNETGTWTVKAYDPDGTNLFYSADWGDVYLQTLPAERKKPQSVSQEATFTHSYSQTGNYKVVFTVTDGKGANNQTSLTVNVNETSANHSPKLESFSLPANIQPGQLVSFNFSATDSDNDNLSWSIGWGDGMGEAGMCSIPTQHNGQGHDGQGWNYSPSHSWAEAGNYSVEVTVSDCNGGSDQESFNIYVSSAITCKADSKIIQRQALGGNEFQRIGLDISSHPKILRYRIQWFGGPWSYWFTPGVNDIDWKTNTDSSSRRYWSYFDDHTHEIEVAESCDTKREKGNPLEY